MIDNGAQIRLAKSHLQILAGENALFNVERDIVDLDPLRPSGRDPEQISHAFRSFK